MAEEELVEEEFVLPAESTFGAARWVKWVSVLFVPIAALCGWVAWDIVPEWLETGKNVWLLAFLLGTLGAMAFLMLAGLAAVHRARLKLDDQGMVLRGAFTERRIPWKEIEGFRVSNGQLFVYPHADWWPANISHFEDQPMILAWLYRKLPDLQELDAAQEVKEIRADLELGMTDGEKAERLGGLRRVVRTINWIAYVAAAIGAANAFFIEDPIVQAAAAWVLMLVPVVLVALAFQHRDRVRLDYKEGMLYPEGLTGILASGIVLGLMSILDLHTLLGLERFWQWTVGGTVLAVWLWLILEWQRIRAQRRWLVISLHILGLVFVCGFWAGGSVYQANKNADVSGPVWSESEVLRMRQVKSRYVTEYYVTVASGSGEPVDLDVARETYDTLKVGAAVRISVRAGALDIPWVDVVTPWRKSVH